MLELNRELGENNARIAERFHGRVASTISLWFRQGLRSRHPTMGSGTPRVASSLAVKAASTRVSSISVVISSFWCGLFCCRAAL